MQLYGPEPNLVTLRLATACQPLPQQLPLRHQLHQALLAERVASVRHRPGAYVARLAAAEAVELLGHLGGTSAALVAAWGQPQATAHHWTTLARLRARRRQPWSEQVMAKRLKAYVAARLEGWHVENVVAYGPSADELLPANNIEHDRSRHAERRILVTLLLYLREKRLLMGDPMVDGLCSMQESLLGGAEPGPGRGSDESGRGHGKGGADELPDGFILDSTCIWFYICTSCHRV